LKCLNGHRLSSVQGGEVEGRGWSHRGGFGGVGWGI
jgi:hypothetical protein